MKKLILIFLSISLFAFTINKNEYFATVEKVADVPVFIFSKPVSEYEIVGKAMSFGDMIKMATDEKSTIRQKTEKIVKTAHKRVKNNKISDFDALIIELENDKIFAIKFKSEISQKAKIDNYDDIPIFFFCEPNKEYNVIKELAAEYSLRAEKRGMLIDKLNSMVKRTLKKRENKDVDYFDGIIINPDDLSEKLITFKNN